MRGILLLCALFLSIQLDALPEQQVHSVDLGVGYDNIITLSVYECSMGYVWIGTKTGLLQFDGYQVKRFVAGDDTSNNLLNGEIHAILEDSSGRLWIGTRNGVSFFDPHEQTFAHYLTSENSPFDFTVQVNHLHEDATGALWLSLEGKVGVIQLSPDGGEAQLYLPNIKDGGSDLAHSVVYKTVRAGERMFAASSIGLFEVDVENGRLASMAGIHPYFGEHLQDVSVYDGRLVTISKNGLIAAFDDSLNLLESFQLQVRNEFRYHIHLTDKNLWVGTFKNGLIRFSLPGLAQETTYLPTSNKNFINSHTIRGFHQPNQHRIWLATDNGISKLDSFVTKLFPENYTPISYDGQPVEVFVVKQLDNRLFVGTSKGLLEMPGSWLITNDEIHDILLTTEKEFALASANRGVIFTSDFRNFETVTIPGFQPRRLIECCNEIFVGGIDGLYRLDKTTREYKSVELSETTSISSLFLQGDTVLWVGSWTRGLHRIDLQTNTYDYYDAEHPSGRGLGWGFNNVVFEDQNRDIYVGTLSGISTWNPENRTFSTRNFISSGNDHVYAAQITPDGKDIWLSTNYGIVRFDPSSQNFMIVEQANGLPDVDFVNCSTYMANSELIFATKNGLVRFFPDSISFNTNTPILQAFLVQGNKQTQIYDQDVIKPGPYPAAGRIELLALEQTLPKHNQYRFLITNRQGETISSGNNRTVDLAELPKGSYRFEFTASNSDGVWKSQPLSFQLRVGRSWFETSWVIAMGLVIMSGLIFMLIRKTLWANSTKPSQDKRYAHSNVAEQTLKEYINQLDTWMETEKPYKASTIYLDDVAERLTISSNILSQAINQVKGVNFYEYINQQRVAEAKLLLADPGNESLNLFGIGVEAGFNSKSTFYAVFKKHTGMTPAQFRAGQK